MKSRLFAVSAGLFLALAFAFPALAARTVPGDALVIFRNPSAFQVSAATLAQGSDAQEPGAHRAYAAAAAMSVGASVTRTYDTLSEAGNDIFVLLHSDTKTEQELLAELRARPDVKGASLNYIKHTLATPAVPDDTYYDKLWGMRAISADLVWGEGHTGSSDLYVVVIDSGIDPDHPDLKDNVDASRSRDFTNNANGYRDANGHGTHVAGIIGAVGNNGEGVTGVNWKVKIIALKPFTDDGNATDADIAAALDEVRRLLNQGVNIVAVNLSLGGWEPESPREKATNNDVLRTALLRVSETNRTVLCVAVGNEDQSVGVPAPCDDPRVDWNGEPLNAYRTGYYCYPASYTGIGNMITVAATNEGLTRDIEYSGSNYSADITAPGALIASTVPGSYQPEVWEVIAEGVNNYAYFSGTSMATPHVTGAVALLKSLYPAATARQIKRALLNGANGEFCVNDRDLVTYTDAAIHIPGDTSVHGILDVKAALDLLPSVIEEGDTDSDSDSDSDTDSDADSDSDSDTDSYTPTPTPPTPDPTEPTIPGNLSSRRSSGGGCDAGLLGGGAIFAGAFFMLLKKKELKKKELKK